MFLARVGWAVYLGLVLWLMIYSIPYADLSLRFDQVISDSYNLFHDRVALSAYLRYFVAIQYAISLFFIGIGCVIFIRKSSDRVALVSSLGLIGLPYMAYFSDLVYRTNPVGTMGRLLNLAEGTASMVSILALSLMLLIFPDGIIMPVWVSRTMRVFFIPVIFSIGLTGFNETSLITPVGPVELGQLSWQLLVLGIYPITVLGLFSQIFKYVRISSSLQRQQTKWVFFSLMIAVFWVVFTIADVASGLPHELRGFFALFVVIMNLLVFGFVPLAFSISIFRYRLYDIDLIIRRTLQYGLLTGLLAGIYFVAVIALQESLGALTGGNDSSLVLISSTLAIVALFNPLRTRVQNFIDRRFYRAKYDAEKVLAGFAASARDEVDLDALAVAMLSAVEETLQPESVNLLLKPPKIRE